VAFLSLIAACGIVFARRFASLRERGWLAFSVVTAVFFLVTWAALGATGSRVGWVSVLFALAVVLGWSWITAFSARLRRTAGT
jgi:hypothetical protein